MPDLDLILQAYIGRGRDALLPLLWEVQTAFGHISPEAVHDISHTLRVPEADIYGVIGFYSLFYSQPTGETIIRICADPSCGLRGRGRRAARCLPGVEHYCRTDDGRWSLPR